MTFCYFIFMASLPTLETKLLPLHSETFENIRNKAAKIINPIFEEALYDKLEKNREKINNKLQKYSEYIIEKYREEVETILAGKDLIVETCRYFQLETPSKIEECIIENATMDSMYGQYWLDWAEAARKDEYN
ncbi:MAG: hypothetical protein ACTSUR_02680 [Candidatus Heimdallarchaeaceae archaeon]